MTITRDTLAHDAASLVVSFDDMLDIMKKYRNMYYNVEGVDNDDFPQRRKLFIDSLYGKTFLVECTTESFKNIYDRYRSEVRRAFDTFIDSSDEYYKAYDEMMQFINVFNSTLKTDVGVTLRAENTKLMLEEYRNNKE